MVAKVVPASLEVRQQAIKSGIVLLSTAANATLGLLVGSKTNEQTGKASPVYAKVKLPGKPQTLTEAVEELSKLTSIRWTLPRLEFGKDGRASTITLTLAPEMSGERAAAIVCFYAEQEGTPFDNPLSDGVYNAHLVEAKLAAPKDPVPLPQ